MIWFVCFDIAPSTAYGIWERKGLSSHLECESAAIQEVRNSMELKYGPLGEPADVFQYNENQD